MPSGTFYVYALLDPRISPPKPFYVGKGHGSRAYAHFIEDGDSRKGQRIREIRSMGLEPLVKQLVGSLSEIEALRIEAQLISAHGTIDTGGILLNRVLPSGEGGARGRNVTVPDGSIERAQLGLNLLKQAILEFAAANEQGITNADTVLALGLQSDHRGEQRNYLTWSVLGILMREGRIIKGPGTSSRGARYRYVKVGTTVE